MTLIASYEQLIQARGVELGQPVPAAESATSEPGEDGAVMPTAAGSLAARLARLKSKARGRSPD